MGDGRSTVTIGRRYTARSMLTGVTLMGVNLWAPLASFLGGGVAAWGIGFIVTNWIRQPVISVQLDAAKGSHAEAKDYWLNSEGKITHTTDARYLRLHIENTGLSTVKDCSGYITKIRRSDGVIGRSKSNAPAGSRRAIAPQRCSRNFLHAEISRSAPSADHAGVTG